MFDWVWSFVFRRCHERKLLVATLGALVKELGGSAVITLDQLNAVGEDLTRVTIESNDDPEGIRIVLRSSMTRACAFYDLT